ncbi:MAG TPA: TonB family protein, partial [Verrucomicrobiae bacterium]|nr:TonB family protein [Verrucomicrobiae bacterium]
LPDPGLRRPGPALRRPRLPLTAIGLSAIGHVVVFGGMAVVVMWSGWRPEKVQVVNLVPMVAAVGTPNAPSAPSLPARPHAPVAPRAPEPDPEPKATTAPREAPRREAPSLPAPSLPTAKPLPPRSTAPPRPGEKELPPLATPPSGSPRGEKTAETSRPPETASLGAPTGSVTGAGALTLDVSDFPYAWYLRQVLQKVEQEWQRQNQPNDPPQKPQVYVEIQRDGSIKSPAIHKSSGNSFYDNAALRAVMAASPFPKLPDDWSKPSLRILFTFDLRRG